MKPLSVLPIQTPVFRARADLHGFIVQVVPRTAVSERMVLAVTSKIVSLAENMLVPRDETDKASLVQREADVYLGEIGHGCHLTVKSGLLMASAGIDESNSEGGEFILYPKDPFASAARLWWDLKKTWELKELGIVITDSHTTPLRRGVTGVCLSFAGFRAVRNLIGTSDLFGRPLKVTQMNFADGLAAAAVMVMGEGAESQPIALIENSAVEFSDEWKAEEIEISLEEDLYGPLLRSFQKVLP
jgi:coenzyme F420-0:L-glutamate ligase